MDLKRLTLGLAPAALLLSVVACGGGNGSGDAEDGSYVTPGIDADLYAALLSDGTTALLFATDSETIHSTLRGDAPAEGAPLSLANDEGDSVQAARTEDGFSGTLTLADGSTHEFTLRKVSRSNGGLYRNIETIRGEEWDLSLIVLNDGKVVGAARNLITDAVEKRTTITLGLRWEDPTADPQRQ